MATLNEKLYYKQIYNKLTFDEARKITAVPIGSNINTIVTNVVNAGVTNASGGVITGSSIGTPTDGTFGTINIASIQTSDSIADAIDKLSTKLEQFLPSSPPNLSTITISLVTSYSAKQQGTNTIVSNVQNSSSGNPITNTTGFFGSAISGTLQANIKNSASSASVQGSIILTSGSDIGTNSYLEIVDDSDYYAGQSGKEGFYNALKARIRNTGVNLTPSDTIQYSYQLTHSTTGNTNTLTFYQDDAYTSSPTISGVTLGTVNTTGAVYISGVPNLTTSNTIGVQFQATNCIKKFYHYTAVAEINGTGINTITAVPTGTDRNEGSNPTFTLTTTPTASATSGSLTVNCIVRNSASVTASDILNANISMDTTSQASSSGGFLNESARKDSGTGQYPLYSGIAYDSSVSLLSNEELQLIDGKYQFPTTTNYTSYVPVGPNYSLITGGSYSNYRWLTFELGSVTNITSAVITINGQENFGSEVLISGFEFQFRIDNVTGWLNGNDAFTPSIPSPSSNGDPCLDYLNSTVSSRRLTLGATPRTGTIVVRMGIPSGSTKKIIGITLVSTN